MWALITLITLNLIGIGIYIAKHGQPMGGKYNFWAKLIADIIIWWLLYEAGLFDKYMYLFNK